MTIDELYRKTNLTRHACETCKINDIHSLEALLEYYAANKTFKQLKRCGSKTNFELIRISRYYSQNAITTDNIDEVTVALNASGKLEVINIFISDESRKLSVRSYNALAAYLKSDFSINNIAVNILYADNFSFDLLRNIGRKSLQELNAFIIKISNFIEQDCKIPLPARLTKQLRTALDPDQQIIKEHLNTLSDASKQLIERQIQYSVKHLSKRACNTLSKALSDNFTLENFTNNILLAPSSSLYEFRGIGEQMIKEITLCAEKVKRFFVSLLTAEPGAISGIGNRLIIESTFFPVLIPNEIFDNLSLFRLLNYILEQQLLFSDIETATLGCFKIYTGQIPKKISNIASKTGLTPERVRQLKLKLQSELPEKLDFLNALTFNLATYGIDLSKDIIRIDDTITTAINKCDGTRFSKPFITLALTLTLKTSYTCIEKVNLQFEKDETLNSDYYLVKNAIEKTVDVNALLKDLRHRTKAMVDTTYSISLSDYLAMFFKKENTEAGCVGQVLPPVKKLIFMEAGTIIDDQGNLTFKRTTPLKVADYCRELLQAAGKPLTLTEIFEEIEKANTGLSASLNIIRSVLQRTDDFVPIGKTSTFGLKKWECEMEEFKGGSIRDIVKELLESCNVPLHISEIAAHVKKYRPNTYDRSILDNLKAQQSKIFSFYKNSHIGLLSRQYPSSYERPKSKPRKFGERLAEFSKFVTTHKRLPYYNRNALQEASLRRWMDLQIKHHTNNSELSDLIKIYR